MLTNHINSKENKSKDDYRLKGLKLTIWFYDADKENVKKLFFKDKNPSEEEIEGKN